MALPEPLSGDGEFCREAGRPGEFHFGNNRFADSLIRVRIPPHIRQEPARRFGRAIRGNAVPATDPLDRGRRPSPGRVAGAPAGRRDRPFQGRRDLPQGPTENSAAPNQHHHLGIMLADQFPDPLTGRVASGSGVDFPASRHDARHDTSRRDQVPPARRAGSSFLPLIGRDRGWISLLQGLVDVQNPDFHLVGRAAGSVSSPRSRIFPGSVVDSIAQIPTNKRNRQRGPDSGPRFFVPLELQTSGSTKTGSGDFQKSPLRAAALVEPGRRQIPYAYPSCRPCRPAQAVCGA